MYGTIQIFQFTNLINIKSDQDKNLKRFRNNLQDRNMKKGNIPHNMNI